MNIEKYSSLILPEEERWENLTLADDFLFGKTFQDEDLCLHLVRLILPELNIKSVSFPVLQRTFRETFDTRGVRLDLCLDEEKQIIDFEMQALNRGNLTKRPRGYHSLVDLEALDRRKMKSYDDLPESIIVFICCFDLFHRDRHIYTFKNICTQDRNLFLNDGQTTIFLNTKGKADDVSPELKAFLNLVNGKTSDDPFVKRIERRMLEVKQNAIWRENYMLGKFERYEYLQEGVNRGISIGEQRANLETARRLIQMGLDIVQIHSATGLPLDDIKKL